MDSIASLLSPSLCEKAHLFSPMETLLQLHYSAAFLTPKPLNRNGSSPNQSSCLLFFSNGFSSSSSVSLHTRQRLSVIVGAKKKRKEDTHHFVPKPDEATGPFPEAVLLKEVSSFSFSSNERKVRIFGG